MSAKRISQREAVRNRRELRRLREFVDRISGAYPFSDRYILTIPDSAHHTQRLRDMAWAADERVVFLATVSGTSIEVRAQRVPEALDATR
jgi:hypothetical protein